MNILVKKNDDEYVLISFGNYYLEITILEIKYLQMCAGYWFTVSQFQTHKFGLLCENGFGPFKYFSLVVFSSLLNFVNRGR